jgi:hypothetical protein
MTNTQAPDAAQTASDAQAQKRHLKLLAASVRSKRTSGPRTRTSAPRPGLPQGDWRCSVNGSAEWALTRRIKINSKLSVDLTVGPRGALAEWIGGMPKTLTDVEMKRYREGRNALLSEVAIKLGGNVLLVEA